MVDNALSTHILFLHLQHTSLDSLENMSSDLSERVKAVASEEAQKVKAVTSEAVKSKAYIYPIKARVQISR